MSGWFLLIIGLASLGLVIAALAYVALSAWRLVRRGLRLSRSVSPVVAELSRKAEAAQQRGMDASGDAAAIQRNVAHLQATLSRLQVVAEAFASAAVRPAPILARRCRRRPTSRPAPPSRAPRSTRRAGRRRPPAGR